MTWDPTALGVVTLPSGRRVRGRALRRPLPDTPLPQFGVYLLGRTPPPVPWDAAWVRWPDFRVPREPDAAATVLQQAWERSAVERVEVACRGGRGRTGTALACLAIIDGVLPEDAVRYVRERYNPRAVETAAQRRFVLGFEPLDL